MTGELYSFRSPNTITKFDDSGNPVATYTTTLHTCDCPAGQRPTCRHRQMLHQLEPIRDTHWFLAWDREVRIGLIVDINGTPKRLLDQLTLAEPAPVPEGPHSEPAPITTEQLDQAQFGRVLHERPQPFRRRI
jgi:hypothetical protein